MAGGNPPENVVGIREPTASRMALVHFVMPAFVCFISAYSHTPQDSSVRYRLKSFSCGECCVLTFPVPVRLHDYTARCLDVRVLAPMASWCRR